MTMVLNDMAGSSSLEWQGGLPDHSQSDPGLIAVLIVWPQTARRKGFLDIIHRRQPCPRPPSDEASAGSPHGTGS